MYFKDGWHVPGTPAVLLQHSWLYAPLEPIYGVFALLSRHRSFTTEGRPLPLTYPDMKAASTDLEWEDKRQLLRWFSMMDSEYLQHWYKHHGKS